MVGTTVSHYEILERLGGGGMGVVYRARDVRLDRTVALKFLPPELTRDPLARQRFVLEAHAASALDHPNICNIHEIDETPDNRTFLCMAFYDGAPLREEIDRGPLEIGRALEIAIPVAEGLSRAHEAGIIHRDIKPGNIMVTSRGEVKIIDFGLAKLAGHSTLTGGTHVVGTAAYMSPEQVRGDPVDHRTDIWSFGMTLYEMLAGEHPFRCDHREAMFYSILSRDPVPLADRRDTLPPGLERLVSCCLEKDPRDRFASMAQLLQELRSVRAAWTPGTSAARSRRYFPQLRVRRFLRGWTIPAAAAAASAFWLLVSGWTGTRHIAVLPVFNIGNDSSNQAVCDGLWETVTCGLSQLERFDRSLLVVPTSEVRQESVMSAAQAQGRLGATHVFSPSLRREGDSLISMLSLVDANTRRQVSSARLAGPVTGVGELGAALVQRMAEMLGCEVHAMAGRALAAGGTADAGASEHYIRGCGCLVRSDRAGNIDRAIAHFSLAIEQDSLFARAYSGLGEAFWRKYRATKDVSYAGPAEGYCGRALEIDSTLPRAHVAMGVVHAGRGRYGEALGSFTRALALDSVNSDACREMARTYGRMGEPRLAENTYRKAIALRPDSWSAHNALGVFYYDQGRYDDAIREFEEVVRLTPDNVRGNNNLGGILFLAERWEEAGEYMERSLAVEPNPVAYSQLGTLYFHTGRYAGAAEMFRGALASSPMDYELLGNLAASLYWVPGSRQEALETFSRAAERAEAQLAVNPRDGDALIALASYCAMMDERDRTLALLDSVIASGPSNSYVLQRIADAYEHVGEREAAVAWIGKAIEAGFSIRMLEAAPGMKGLREDARVGAKMVHRQG